MCVEHFGELHRVTLRRNQSLYTLPLGEVRPYFSFDGLAHRISEAHVSDNPVVRHTSVANKWKTVHLLLYSGHNATQVQYNLTFQRDDQSEFTMSFGVAVDTREVPRANTSKTAGKDSGKETKPTPTPEPVLPFSDVPEDKRGPKIQRRRPGEPQVVAEVPSLDESLLPVVVLTELRKLDEKLQAGDITVKGYNVTKAELLKPFKAQQQQVVQPQAAAQVQGKPYKDLEGGVEPPVEEKPADIQKNQKSKEETSKKSVAVKTAVTTPLIPVHIDDGANEEFERQTAPPVNAAIERPKASKLLSSISKIRSSEGEKEPANAAAGAPVGRRLQHFVSADRGFLPWERRKFFQQLLEVGGAPSLTVTCHYYLHASLPVCVLLCRRRSVCRSS